MASTYVMDCPNCPANSSTFRIPVSFPRPDWLGGGVVAAPASCAVCGDYALLRLRWVGPEQYRAPHDLADQSIERHGWIVDEVLPPQRTAGVPDALPEKVQTPYLDSVKCLHNGIYAGAGMLARKTIERAVGIELGQDEVRSLRSAIEKFSSQGRIPGYVNDWAEHVRALGNDAAHRDDFNEPEAKEAVEFTEEFVRTLYTRPARVADARNRYEKPAEYAG